MKKSVITIAASLVVVSVIGISTYADIPEVTEHNGVEQTVTGEGTVKTDPTIVTEKQAEKLMSNIEVKMPTYTPEGYKLSKDVLYDEPPEQFNNGVKTDVEVHKQIQFRYLNDSKPESYIDYITKEAEVQAFGDDTEKVTVQGVEGQISVNEDANNTLLVWNENNQSHMLVAQGDFSKEEILKMADSVQ
ncbi:DUF4367 domain-containing protein [Priestia sp. OVL9]|nr:DUF4367 domain-containing protein [Priestia sp. OVL9]MCJ7983749.1 DUF4367 domain-containing protein [Priestia sp. OVL9]